uniref:polynucleotide adenylyltransferase n=1 Tax=Globodera pallida TaxID=36090 RepID=A0A183BXA1_GLOPA
MIQLIHQLIRMFNYAEIEEQMLESFKNNLIKYKKLDFQRKLDKNCLELYKSDEFLMQNYDAKLKKANIDLYQISDAWQQIDFDEITSKNFENVGAVENKEERTVKLLAINQLKTIFEYWSDEARFQMPVSHYLKPANEAMNTICMLPECYIDDGTYAFDQNKSDQLKRQLEEEVFLTDNDDDVVRILDALEKINNLKASNKIESVNPSGLATMNHENDKQNRQKMENIKANLTILSSHAFHLKILEFLLTRNELYQINHKLDENVMNGSTLRNFRAAYAYLELWAKKRNIFNANFGHYNSQVIIILLTKVFLLFPGNVSVPFLLEKFFFIFSTWDWPLPLQLSEIEYKKEGEFLSWTTGREWFDKRQENNSGQQFSLQMPIISPVFPEQNMTKLINASDAKKIQNEFLIAFKKIRAVKEGMTIKNGRDGWHLKFDFHKISDKILMIDGAEKKPLEFGQEIFGQLKFGPFLNDYAGLWLRRLNAELSAVKQQQPNCVTFDDKKHRLPGGGPIKALISGGHQIDIAIMPWTVKHFYFRF